MTKRIDLTNKKFNRLTVIKFHSSIKGIVRYECLCDCGNITVVKSNNLKNGHTKSCGCYNISMIVKRNTSHNFSKTRFYKIWGCMISRCSNKKGNRYHCYGGKGISVCDRWLKFENFKDDMYDLYLKHVDIFGEKDTSIDRIDVNGNYEPSNCKWSTNKEQSSNTSKNRWFKAISPNKQEFIKNNQAEFSNNYNLSKTAVNMCLNKKQKEHKGWTFIFLEELIINEN